MFSTRFSLALALFFALLLGSTAQRSFASPLHAVQGYTVAIPAGGTGTIQVQAIALRPTSNLPAGALSLAAQPLAADKVRTALYYGIDWGYANTDTYQVAQAVWWVQDSAWQSTDHETAERIGTAAVSTAGIPSWNPEGVSVLTLLQSGQISISSLTLAASTQNPSIGSGSLVVTNNSANTIRAFLPYGTLFGTGNEQVLVWASGQAVQDPQVPPAPTDTPQPAAPTATQGATGKGGGSAPAATATTKSKGPSKGKPETAPTDTPLPLDTPTPLPTATEEPTVAPTNAPVESKPKSGGAAQPPAQSPGTESAPLDIPDTQGETSTSQAAPSGEKNSSAGSSGATGEAAGTGASGSAASVRPDGSVKGPILPPAATATPVNHNAPQPVGTTFIPQAVDTSEAQIEVPNAQATNQAPIPNPQSTQQAPLPVITNVATIETVEVKPTDVPVVDPGTGDGTVPVDLPPTEEVKPTPVPTPAPPPTDVTVDASSGSDPSGGSPPVESVGSPPTINPATGAGRSDLPTWLSIMACMMMLVGWTVRHTSRAPVPVKANTAPTDSIEE